MHEQVSATKDSCVSPHESLTSSQVGQDSIVISEKPLLLETSNPFLYFLKTLPEKKDEEIAKSSSTDIPKTLKVSDTQVSDPLVPEVINSENLVYHILVSISKCSLSTLSQEPTEMDVDKVLSTNISDATTHRFNIPKHLEEPSSSDLDDE